MRSTRASLVLLTVSTFAFASRSVFAVDVAYGLSVAEITTEQGDALSDVFAGSANRIAVRTTSTSTSTTTPPPPPSSPSPPPACHACDLEWALHDGSTNYYQHFTLNATTYSDICLGPTEYTYTSYEAVTCYDSNRDPVCTCPERTMCQTCGVIEGQLRFMNTVQDVLDENAVPCENIDWV